MHCQDLLALVVILLEMMVFVFQKFQQRYTIFLSMNYLFLATWTLNTHKTPLIYTQPLIFSPCLCNCQNISFIILIMSSWGTNPKALEKRQKQKQKRVEQQQRKEENAERAKWKDEETEKYLQKKKEKKIEANEEQRKKEEKKRLQEEEQKEMEKYSKKGKTQTKKLTVAEIALRQMKHMNINVDDSGQQEPEKPNNAPIGQNIEAHTVSEALQQLQDDKPDKHPQKRMKASWNRFLQQNLPRMKAQYPSLKRSQHIDMLQDQWKKSPENPFNQKVAEYNTKV